MTHEHPAKKDLEALFAEYRRIDDFCTLIFEGKFGGGVVAMPAKEAEAFQALADAEQAIFAFHPETKEQADVRADFIFDTKTSGFLHMDNWTEAHIRTLMGSMVR